ncbi:DNA-directed RNA polymerase V subunit 7 [Camellia lanceoleosa]|uniref:DNA-directed RNA polymerase V subunit 7 n=1 Tax=Camellia lanceoleosa TaxID=1840588 RepID=A0ACC0I3I6_9ERIC|nr:DNA-directed RNA polymerase V subunit 7 [Camellia lanceoleosa]
MDSIGVEKMSRVDGQSRNEWYKKLDGRRVRVKNTICPTSDFSCFRNCKDVSKGAAALECRNSAESLDTKGLMLQKSIIIRLLDDFSTKKATKELGYFLALITLDNIGEGRVRQHSGDGLFPVLCSCITFKLHRGKILEGVVHKILKHGVFLRCGPVENIYLSNQKMHDYRYVPGENPIFMNDKMSRIEKEVAVRFIVIGTKYIEAEKDFQAVVSLEGDFLGPVS